MEDWSRFKMTIKNQVYAIPRTQLIKWINEINCMCGADHPVDFNQYTIGRGKKASNHSGNCVAVKMAKYINYTVKQNYTDAEAEKKLDESVI